MVVLEYPKKISTRLSSIDTLRGLVIILMALDHVRDFWSSFPYRPDDVSQASVSLFLTRWVTHLCAPTFIFLAGVSIFLYQQKVENKQSVSLFLIKRGVWMIVLEIFVVNFLWQFSYNVLFLQVIWIIGWSMLVMAALIWLPRWMLIVAALAIVGFHQLLSLLEPQQPTMHNLLWVFFHRPVLYMSMGDGVPPLFDVYPLIPWAAVMLGGYLIGPWFRQAADQRKNNLLRLGSVLIVFFIALRATNGYGDPNPWAIQERGWIFTLLSYISISKYPPSLLYICLTLGIASFLLILFERTKGMVVDFLGVFGRVPLFFYLIHIPIINLGALIWTYLSFGKSVNFFFTPSAYWPADYVPHLWLTYLVWAALVAGLYFVCRWYGNYKRQHPYQWLKYL